MPEPDRVLDVIARADFTPDGIAAHEAAAARERRRQRRAAEMGAAPGGGGAFGGAPAGAAPGGAPLAGQKRPMEEFDSGSEDEGGGHMSGGMDIYRMRRKQQRS